jgi:CubicO group peptidase (beta-lactamase class C family)
MRTALAVWVALAATAGCNKAQVVSPLADSAASYAPGTTWRTADAGAAGFDAARLRAVGTNVTGGRYGAVDAVVVVRYGYVVHEQYNGWDPARPHALQSVSKSVTALLYGILSGRGDAALDIRVTTVLSRFAPIANHNANKDSLRVRDLLKMRASMDYWEQPYAGSPHEALNQSKGDWTRLILDRPMTSAPGTTWSYNSGAAILTCSLIREITGDSVHAFARRELFNPIGITTAYWIVSPFDALPHCGGGLHMQPVDLARIGYLVLRHGKWGDTQVVPAGWIQEMTQPHTTGGSLYFSSYGSGYGYFWWLFPVVRGGTGYGVIAGSGSGGQWLFVVPSKDLVIVVAASNGNGLEILYDVLGALK